MNPIIGEILGYACGACTTIAFLPQAIKSIISKDVSGLSLSMYVIYCIGLIFWVLYGVYLDSFQIQHNIDIQQHYTVHDYNKPKTQEMNTKQEQTLTI